jgi:hypothetical protein
MCLRSLVVPLVAALALAIPTAASAKVRLVYLTTPRTPGSHATLVVSVSPARKCTITVLYKSGSSHAQGLTPKRPTRHKIAWSWMVGTKTTSGRWPIYVDCGSAGLLRTSFVVR